MANGLVQYSENIINDFAISTKTAYSSKKIEDLVKNLGVGNANYVSILGCYQTAPATCIENDIYYNTIDKLLYTATATDTWNTAGKTPEVDTFYLDIADNYIYTYIDNKFEMYGGAGLVNVSNKANNAIQEVTGSTDPDEDGLFVENISDDIKRLILKNHYKDDEAYFFATNTDTTKSYKIWAKNTSLINCLTEKRNGKLKVSSDGYITLTEGIWSLSAGTINGGNDLIDMHWVDRAGDILSNGGFVQAGANSDSDIDSNAIVTVEQGNTLEVAPIRKKGNTNIETCFSFVKVYRVGIQRVDPLEYININKNLEDTPVGHIMTVMSNTAPAHYLKCDGSVYNIIDYPKLADHFKTEFGSINYFGGNGITTFAVPNLNGEFLRGTGISKYMNQGNGSRVGEHQDATDIPYLFTFTDGSAYLKRNNLGAQTTPEHVDSAISSAPAKSTKLAPSIPIYDDPSATITYTTRPTNTSVLYVIKYEPTYTTNIYATQKIDILDSNPREYLLTLNSVIDLRSQPSITLTNPISDYDYIELDSYIDSGDLWGYKTTSIPVANIVYNSTPNVGPMYKDTYDINTQYSNGSFTLHFAFIDNNNIQPMELDNTATVAGDRAIIIKEIRGIKVMEKSEIIPGGSSEEVLTDAEIENAINESVAEINR